MNCGSILPHSVTRSSSLSILCLFIGLAPLLHAGEIIAPVAEPIPEPEPSFGQWLWETDRLTGDWGGLRPALEENGIKFSAYYNQFYAWKSRGGRVPPSKGAFSGSFDLFGFFDFGKMGLIPGGEILVQAKNNWGFSVNPEVGAFGAPIDDADGPHNIYIDQLYYQQSLFKKKIQFRVGYIDHQTIIDRNAFANSEDTMFMNTFLDNNNAIIPLTIGPGASIFLNPNDWLSFVFSAADSDNRLFQTNLDTVFDGNHEYNLYFETDLKATIPTETGPLVGHYRFGLVHDPITRAVWGTDSTDSSNVRFYLSCDQQVYSEPDQVSGQGLGVFCRYGRKDGDLNFGINPTEHFWSVGAQYKGLFPTRDNDALGLATYSVIASDSRRRNNPGDADLDRETGYELYYRYQLTPAVALSPGVQYIHQPGTRTTTDDAWVLAFRSRFAF